MGGRAEVGGQGVKRQRRRSPLAVSAACSVGGCFWSDARTVVRFSILPPARSSQHTSSLAAPGIPWAASPQKTGYLSPTPRQSVLPGLAGAQALGVLSAVWRTALCGREALRMRGKLSPPRGPGNTQRLERAGRRSGCLSQRDPHRGDGSSASPASGLRLAGSSLPFGTCGAFRGHAGGR